MEIKRFRYWLLPGVVLVAFGVVYHDIQSHSFDRASRERTTTLDEGKADVAEADKRESLRTSAALGSRAPGERHASISEQVDSPSSEVSEEELNPEGPSKTPEEFFVELSNSIEEDEKGGSEAETRRKEIESALDGLETPGVRVVDSACSKSYCKVEVRFPGEAEDKQAISELLARPDELFTSRRMIIPHRMLQQDGTIHATIFLLEPSASQEKANHPTRHSDQEPTLL